MTSTTALIHLLVLSSLILLIRSQSCATGSQYSPCSSNGQCGCLQLSFASSAFLCGVVSYDCSQFSVCQPNSLCPSGYICVRHPSCDSRSLCYPMNMLTDQVCPPVFEYQTTQASTVFSNYNGVLNSADGLYNRPGGSTGTYYEAIQLHVPTSGYYDLSSVSGMDTHGYLYDGTFYPSNPQTNLIAHNDDDAGGSQFKLPVYLQAGHPYTLVVSTHSSGVQGAFSVSASGPDNIYFTPLHVSTTTTTTQPLPVTSYYSGNLTSFNFHFDRTGNGSSNYYYQAYEIRVDTTGTYTFTSSSGYDTYGYIYQGNFYPFQPNVNMHSQDDDGAGSGQFRLTVELRADIKYILVFTTFAPNTFGTYTVTASGPGNVYLQPISSTFS